MSIQEQRDNLTIGLTLVDDSRYRFGCTLDELLTQALGHTPGEAWPIGNRDHYISRLRQAQNIGLKKYALREPGYFTINAQPFGNIFLYKAVWYTLYNPDTDRTCIVLVSNTDLTPMRRWRDQYLATRTGTTRSVRAADNLIRQEWALERGDARAVRDIQAGMVNDGTLSEVITGLLGVPHVDVPEMLNLLSQGNPYGTGQYSFTRQAQQIRELENRLADAQVAVVRSLSNLISARQSLPQNAVSLALRDARQRLDDLQ